MVPNDEYYHYQWHLDNAEYGGIGMEEAWDISTGLGVTVAIIDTGVTVGTDLADTCFVSGYDFVNDDASATDDNGHGTHVAGTVAQSTNNGLGVAGVAYNVCLMPVKVLDSAGSGTYADVAEGIIWAANNGAQVINLSLGGSATSETLENAVAYAYSNGATVVAAVGNDSSSRIRLNGWYTYVTAVVTIVDADGDSVEGATVYGSWSGLTDGTDFGTTDTNGKIALDSDAVKNADGTFTFTVTDVVLDGWMYDSRANVETSDSITVN